MCNHTVLPLFSVRLVGLQWVDVLHIPEVISGCGYTCTQKGRKMARVEPYPYLTWQQAHLQVTELGLVHESPLG